MHPDEVAVVVQARTGSTRYPGKVLASLAGAPAIIRMMERVHRIRGAGVKILATSDDDADDGLAECAAHHGIDVVRGSLLDVLGRIDAAVPEGCETVVRLTGDCPLVDPGLVDHHLTVFARERPRAVYVTNTAVRTYPDGLDIEVVSRKILRDAASQATALSDREHVLPWVRRHAHTVLVTQEIDLSPLRWTLDTPDDYDNLAAIFDRLYPNDPDFDRDDVLRLLVREPDLIRLAHGTPSPPERVEWTRRIEMYLAATDAP